MFKKFNYNIFFLILIYNKFLKCLILKNRLERNDLTYNPQYDNINISCGNVGCQSHLFVAVEQNN